MITAYVLDWTPEQGEDIVTYLVNTDMVELTPEMLDEKLSTPSSLGPFQFNTAGELFNFALIHEAIHLGTISSQLKVLSR